MGEVLSQNEIDSLLKALSSGELDVDEIKDDNEKQVKNMILLFSGAKFTIPSNTGFDSAFANSEYGADL